MEVWVKGKGSIHVRDGTSYDLPYQDYDTDKYTRLTFSLPGHGNTNIVVSVNSLEDTFVDKVKVNYGTRSPKWTPSPKDFTGTESKFRYIESAGKTKYEYTHPVDIGENTKILTVQNTFPYIASVNGLDLEPGEQKKVEIKDDNKKITFESDTGLNLVISEPKMYVE